MRVWSTFNPAAPGTPVGYDSYAWADRPAAADYTGRVIRVTDIGVGGGGLFMSDGTYWRPLNGHLVLAAENLSAITTTQVTGTTTAIPGWSLTIPAGLFDRPGTSLRGMIRAQLEGTVGTGGSPQANVRALFTGGGGSLATRNLCRTSTLSGAAPYGHGLGLMTRISSTSIHFVQESGNHIWSGSASASGTDAGLPAGGSFSLYLAGGISTTPGAGELLRFKDVLVELIG